MCSTPAALSNATVVVTNSGLVVDGSSFVDGTLELASGSATANSEFLVGVSTGSTGLVSVTGGTLSVTNGVLGVGNTGSVTTGSGSGSIVVSNGTVVAASVQLGSAVGGSGDLTIEDGGEVTVLGGLMGNDVNVEQGALLQVLWNPTGFAFEDPNLHNRIVAGYQRDGALNLSGGTVIAPEIVIGLANGTGTLNLTNGSVTASNLIVGMNSSATGMVMIVGGTLTATDGVVQIGPAGNGQMTIAGGSVIAQKIHLGGVGASGKVVLNAGFVRAAEFILNWWVGGGGDMDGCGGTMLLGAVDHDSLFEMHAGSATNLSAMYVGYGAGLTGTYTQDGGLTVVTTNMIIGDRVSNATGVVTLSGAGVLYVTNEAHNAVLDVRKGSFVMTNGTLVVDILRFTNKCGGTFNHLGGTLQYAQLDVDPNGDADSDGQSNARELAAGTDPFNAGSSFRMLGITKTNAQDLRIDWTTVSGHSYVVQTNGNLKAGTFNDLSGAISVGGTGEGTTNYVHAGAVTNWADFYCVRLQQ